MDTPLAQQLALSTFTPSTMPPTVLEGMFVQREQLLQSIVQELSESVDDTKKFLMLVGARGMGKTHLVSLVYHRLKQKPELGEKLLIAWLREEEYGVNSWLYLIVEILRSLGLEGVETETQITKLANLPIGDAEYLADRVLREVIGDRTLLIITENIDKLLFGLGEKEQWKFRAFLQETNCCSILATTPKISQDTGRKEKPFFGFFTPIHLPVLTHVDAVAMLINIANLSGNSGLVKFLETVEGQSRVRALHHLAGGNPRVYALFAQLVTEESLEALLPAVLEMLDKLTPYYQSRVESLGQSDDQQKIVMYLTRETRAVTVKEITAQCFISSDRTTSNALKKLKEKGYVISTQKGREVFYEISEVLMRLCLEMKNARSGNLKFWIDFLRIWYRQKPKDDLKNSYKQNGVIGFPEETYTDDLTLWKQAFENIKKLHFGNAGDLILNFLNEELLSKFQQPSVYNLLPQILNIYTSTQVLPELGVALIQNLKAIQDPKISDYTAIEWLKMWQELGKPYPELSLALKMLEAGIKYKQNSKDDRIFLSLPQEMRPILREALGLSGTNENR
jgi:DNA-binding transcriptional ArsR family regulator